MKLPKSFLCLSTLAGSAFGNAAVYDECMKCSYVGAAATEELALQTMSGVQVNAADGKLHFLEDTKTEKLVPCLHGQARSYE